MATHLVTVRRPGAALLRIAGIGAVTLSSLGLVYMALYLSVDYSRRERPPYFFQAWYTMVSVNAVVLILAILIGIDFIRLRTGRVRAFLVVEGLILIAAFIPGMLWLNQTIGHSVAAASGISGGLIFQEITLFPFWGSALAVVGSRRLRASDPKEQGA